MRVTSCLTVSDRYFRSTTKTKYTISERVSLLSVQLWLSLQRSRHRDSTFLSHQRSTQVSPFIVIFERQVTVTSFIFVYQPRYKFFLGFRKALRSVVNTTLTVRKGTNGRCKGNPLWSSCLSAYCLMVLKLQPTLLMIIPSQQPVHPEKIDGISTVDHTTLRRVLAVILTGRYPEPTDLRPEEFTDYSRSESGILK